MASKRSKRQRRVVHFLATLTRLELAERLHEVTNQRDALVEQFAALNRPAEPQRAAPLGDDDPANAALPCHA